MRSIASLVFALLLFGCPVATVCRIVDASEKGVHTMAELERCCAGLPEGGSDVCATCSAQPQCGFCKATKRCLARPSVTSTTTPSACASGWAPNPTECTKPDQVPPGAAGGP